MNKKVTINGKESFVEFSGYFDSAYGDFLFTQVMCDVFMPGQEVVPIAAEKEQIRRVLEAFKKRKALHDEIRKENVKGKSVYVITPRMRYDLEWLEGKKKVILSKDKPPVYEPVDTAAAATVKDAKPQEEKPRVFEDSRRRYLLSEGFQYNEATNNWEIGTIRFPDALIGKAASDEEFIRNMTRLREADTLAGQKKKTKTTSP